jgi:hypothetical protein
LDWPAQREYAIRAGALFESAARAHVRCNGRPRRARRGTGFCHAH